MLKVYFDLGKDHADMFMPFVLDTIAAMPLDNFVVSDLRTAINERHSLDIPEDPLRTLLSRAVKVKKGSLRREVGRFFREPSFRAEKDLLETRKTIESEHLGIARSLRDFALARDMVIASDEEALSLLLGFLDQNYMTVLLSSDANTGPAEAVSMTSSSVRTIAAYFQFVLSNKPDEADRIQRMVEGYVLQKVLLLKDIADVERRFRSLEVFLDSRILFRILGLEGEAEKVVSREGIGLLTDLGATLFVFDRTLAEMKRILSVYIEHLSTPDGMLSLWQTPLSRYFLKNHCTPSDVKQIGALLELNVKQLGIGIREFPQRTKAYTFEEKSLSERLLKEGQTEPDARVDHDVDCIAAIITYRAGKRAYLIEDSKAIFVTTTSLLVKHTTEWYRAQGESGVPPIMRCRDLFNAAWIKKPASASRLRMHELVALCAAALRPGREIWEAFIRELRKLIISGQLSSEESVALLISDLAESRLSEIDDELDVDATTVSEVVDRVRAEYEERARKEIERVELRAAKEIEEVHEQVRSSEEVRRVQIEAGITKMSRLEEDRAITAEARRQLEMRLNWLASLCGKVAANVTFLVLGLSVALGVSFGIPGFFPHSPGLRMVAYILAVLVVCFTILNLFFGICLNDLRAGLKRRIEKAVLLRLMPKSAEAKGEKSEAQRK